MSIIENNDEESKIEELEDDDEQLEIEELEDDEKISEIEELENNDEQLEIKELKNNDEEFEIEKKYDIDELDEKRYKCLLKRNNLIELITISPNCKDLFLSPTEKIKNIIAVIILCIGIPISFYAPIFITCLIFNDIDIKLYISCTTMIIIFFILLCIFVAIYKKLFTKIKYIKLRFTSKGIKLTSSRKTKNSIFIKYKNIADIYLKKCLTFQLDRSIHIKPIIKLILQTHKPIISIHNQKKFSELALIEKLDNYYLSDIKNLITDLKNILKIK